MKNDDRELEAFIDAICQATLKISQVGDLVENLQRIVDTARDLLLADYAVLASFGLDILSEHFVFSGLDEKTAALIANHPEGIGLLGAVSAQSQTLRLDNLTEHPQFSGFPLNLPEMEPFMGTPIVQNEQVYGRIYVANKKGGKLFTATDEKLLTLFANHAAVAIQNAQLISASLEQRQQLQLRNRQLSALDKATMAIAGAQTLDNVLKHIVDVARDLVEAQYAALGVPNSAGYMEAFVDSGMEPEVAAGIPHLPKGLGLLGAIIEEQEPIRIPKIGDDPRSVGFPPGHPPMDSLLGVPVIASGEILGNLYLTNKLNAPEFTQMDQDIVELLAAHAAIAIENARLYEQVGRLAIIDERTRIGMDLHDGVIQSIFAVGLTLESTKLSMKSNPQEADNLLEAAINGLNATIRDIRNFILDLRPHRFQGNLEQGLGRLVREFQANTMVAVSLSAQQEVFGQLPASVARSLFLTMQEALANIARHAQAKQVMIRIEPQKDNVVLRISDDGQGFDMASKSYSVGHGLSNMRARAEDLDGSFDIKSAPGQGTTVKLIFPLEPN